MTMRIKKWTKADLVALPGEEKEVKRVKVRVAEAKGGVRGEVRVESQEGG